MIRSRADHPFVERIRAERAIVAAVNSCRAVVGIELAGTSERAIVRWFEGTPPAVRRRASVLRLRDELVAAGQTAKLASNGSHRGAMLATIVRREAMDSAVERVRRATADVRAGETAATRRSDPRLAGRSLR